MTTLTLKDGLQLFGKSHKNVILRSATAGDIIDASMDSERLVMAPDGPVLLSSPSLTGAHITRRRIARIGEIEGPLDIEHFRTLSSDDLGLLQNACDAMDRAQGKEVAKLLDKAGRGDGAGIAG